MGMRKNSNALPARTERHVFPSQADGVTLQTGVGDWELGGMTIVVPEDYIDKPFTIENIVIESVNRPNKTFELVLYSGEHDTERFRRRFVVNNNSQGSFGLLGDVFKFPADAGVKARLAVQGGKLKIAVISLQYDKKG